MLFPSGVVSIRAAAALDDICFQVTSRQCAAACSVAIVHFGVFGGILLFMTGVVATLDIIGVLDAAALEYLDLKVTSEHSAAALQALIGLFAFEDVLALEFRFEGTVAALVLHCCFLFVFTAAAALTYHVVDVLHDLVQRSIGAGTDDGFGQVRSSCVDVPRG